MEANSTQSDIDLVEVTPRVGSVLRVWPVDVPGWLAPGAQPRPDEPRQRANRWISGGSHRVERLARAKAYRRMTVREPEDLKRPGPGPEDSA